MVKNEGTVFLRALVHELFQPYYDIEIQQDFKEDNVCKWQLVSPFGCPHLLFPNARSDLGPCSKKHDVRLKQKYDQDKNKDSYPYEQWFFNYLQRLILHLDRKIKNNQARLHGYSMDIDEENDERWEKIIELDEKINEMILKSEEYGLNGNVEESFTLATQIDQLQIDLEQLKNITKHDDKSFDVCPVCSAKLIVNDTTNRTGIHIDGKQHQGYQKIRDHFNYLQSNRPDLVEESVKQYQRQQEFKRPDRRDNNYAPRENREQPHNQSSGNRDSRLPSFNSNARDNGNTHRNSRDNQSQQSSQRGRDSREPARNNVANRGGRDNYNRGGFRDRGGRDSRPRGGNYNDRRDFNRPQRGQRGRPY